MLNNCSTDCNSSQQTPRVGPKQQNNYPNLPVPLNNIGSRGIIKF